MMACREVQAAAEDQGMEKMGGLANNLTVIRAAGDTMVVEQSRREAATAVRVVAAVQAKKEMMAS